jgi:hypothetical protein
VAGVGAIPDPAIYRGGNRTLTLALQNRNLLEVAMLSNTLTLSMSNNTLEVRK